MAVKRYLVTGAAGFIGANFIKDLVNRYGDNIDILVLDALTYAGNLMTISDELARDNVSFVKADIADEAAVERIFADYDPDYVVNFAAETHVDRSITHPRIFARTNILGTQTLLEAARKAWLDGKDEEGKPRYREGKKFLQISTDEVYGSLSRDYDTPQPLEVSDAVHAVIEGRRNLQKFGDSLFTEETPLAPRSPYSAAKTSADLFTLAYHETFGLPVNITRMTFDAPPIV